MIKSKLIHKNIFLYIFTFFININSINILRVGHKFQKQSWLKFDILFS